MSMMTYLTNYDFCSLCPFMYVLIRISLAKSVMMLLFHVTPHLVLMVSGTCGAWNVESLCMVNYVVVSCDVGCLYSYVWKAYDKCMLWEVFMVVIWCSWRPL